MKNKNCGIYKITSPTGKVYIGQSTDIKKRWAKYMQIKYVKGQPAIYRSFIKYGVEAHQFDIIEYCTEEDLNCSERFWQDEFDVLGKDGLNCVLQTCGENFKVVGNSTRKKLSESNKGFKSGLSKHIICQETGIFYESVEEASKAFNISKTGIRKMLLGAVQNKTSLIYSDNLEKGIKSSQVFSEDKKIKYKRPYKEEGLHIINYLTKEIYYSIREASIKECVPYQNIMSYLTMGVENRTDLMFVKDFNLGLTPSCYRHLYKEYENIVILDKITKTKYSFSTLSKELSISEYTILEKLILKPLHKFRYVIYTTYDGDDTVENNFTLRGLIVSPLIIDVITKKVYDSYRKAEKVKSMPQRSLNSILKGTFRNTTDYMFLDDFIKGGSKDMYYTSKSRNKNVIDTNTGKVFKSIREASRFSKIQNNELGKMLNGIKENTTTFKIITNDSRIKNK